jgi:2-amino-4-hydroxy-6-hydroxymethyldihydropteridine diphosphokinase
MRNGGTPTTAYIGIGSNLGDRARQCYDAVARMSLHEQIKVIRFSPLIETAPVGGPSNAPPFLNGAVQIETSLGARNLMTELLAIETSLGRQRRDRWEPRIIDLDLLLFGDKILSGDDLLVPHPMMHQRQFVLEPLALIAPDVVHPTLQMTIQGLLESINSSTVTV